MPRAIWSGSVGFGLLNIPVKLYSATSSHRISFRELRESDGSRIRHKRVAEADGKEVPNEKIVKGYELGGDRYLVLTKDELEALEPEKSREIRVEDFVKIEEIDPVYFDRPYFLAPDKGAERAYSLLVKAMKESGMVAIARFVLRNKEHLAAIRPIGPALSITTMRFADEVVSPEEIADELPADAKVPKQELEMARQLIDSLVTDFKPESYEDEYRQELIDLIERKARGEEVVAPKAETPAPTKAPDLMAALRESVAAVKAEDSKASRKPAAKKKRTTAKKPAAKSKTKAKK
jgi:DNA end-binding protein Ku